MSWSHDCQLTNELPPVLTLHAEPGISHVIFIFCATAVAQNMEMTRDILGAFFIVALLAGPKNSVQMEIEYVLLLNIIVY